MVKAFSKTNTNTESFRKLKFFEDFLSMEGLTLEQAGNIINVSRPTVSHWLSIDDAHLKDLQDIIEHFGYKFEIDMTRDGDENTKARISMEDFIYSPGEQFIPNRLTFLTVALRRYGITKTELAKRLGILYTSLRYYYRNDDISISRIFEIARVCDFNIRIRFSKKVEEQPERNSPKKLKYIVEVDSTNQQLF